MLSAAEAIERFDRSPHWVWVSLNPESTVRLPVDVGEHTLATAQLVVHHVVQILAPDCAPLFLTYGLREYINTAFIERVNLSMGSARQWRPHAPAMAAGLTEHVWTLRAVLLFRGPPWPQAL
jgi:hypothetical protein